MLSYVYQSNYDNDFTYESIIVENQTKNTIYKKKGKGVISIAPGENKVAIPIMFFHYQFAALVYFPNISDS